MVGSYPQPDWLADRSKLGGKVPRLRMPELWRVPESNLREAQDDATVAAIAEMERAGVDIVTDGEIRRESYSNRFATALEGVDLDNPGTTIGRTGKATPVPRIVGPIRRTRPVQVRDVTLLRANATRTVKATLPGPFTLSMQAQDEYYRDPARLAMAYAEAVNNEVLDLFAAGADIVQLDEPWMQARPEQAREFAVEAIDRAFRDVPGTTAVHLCFGYAASVSDKPTGYSFAPELDHCAADQVSIEAAQPGVDPLILEALPTKDVLFGVISMGSPDPESPELVARRIRAALEHIEPERLIVAPDCGMKYLPRRNAFEKLSAMCKGARMVRDEIAQA